MSAGNFRGFAAAMVLFVSLLVGAGVNQAQALTPRGFWAASVTYALDDIVILRGSTWRSKHNTNKGKLPGQTSPTSTAADWELFASGFNPLGSWKSTTTYQKNDVVLAANGAVYRALRTNANKTPGLPANTADWQVFVMRGATGAPGPQGAPGSTAVGDGSTTAPAFKFTTSPDSGMFSPGGGKVALTENGALFLHDIGVDNLALGLSALALNTTGKFNIAIGEGALGSNDTGSKNIAIGLSALGSNNSGSFNTAIGYVASGSNLTGSRNTVLGYSGLQFSDEGNDNTAIGYLALQKNTKSDNTAVGSQAMTSNTSGVQNTAVGNAALISNTTGSLSTAVGAFALNSNSVGYYNSSFGAYSLYGNTTGVSNTGIGINALYSNTEGSSNTAVGNFALATNTTGGNNTAVGFGALDHNEGAGNIAVGADAGNDPTASSNGIFIGNHGLDADTATIKIGTQGTQTTAFIAGIHGITTGEDDAVAVLVDSNGQLGTVSSSRRYKEDIHPMGAMSDMLSRLRPVSFRYRKPYADGSKPLQYGLIAEEVAEAFPYLAVFNGEGQPETVKYHELPAFLLEGFQEQQKVIAAQAERIASLEARLAAIEAMLQPPTITAASASR